MTETDFDRLSELYRQAMEQPETRRRQFLADRCGTDSSLFAQLTDLVAHSDAAASFFDDLRGELGRAGGDELDLHWGQGRVLGAYRLIRPLGSGGMGTVYLAERADGTFQRRVALKFVPLGSESPGMISRFNRERKLLAQLDHPHIAQLLDAGLTQENRPYFVMEYVEGESIVDHCDRRTCSIAERLRLLLQVCDAVQYAHQNLVIHRDIKPGNIMVGADGTAKLLDFGIAKLLGEDVSIATRTAARVLTPAYAAPEQLSGAGITTGTDVYGLGMVLYELLTGRRASVLRDGRYLPPTAPSRCITRTTNQEAPAPSEVAQRRASRVAALCRTLRGDLDTITLKALAEDPRQRYADVAGLAGDLRRFLAGHPITTRGVSRWYRFRKFAVRNAMAVGFTAVTVIALVGAALFSTFQAHRTAAERDKAEQVIELLTDVFQMSDPAQARGRNVSAREVLEMGVQRVARGLDHQPLVKAQLLIALARTMQHLGLYQRAAGLFDQVADLALEDPTLAAKLQLYRGENERLLAHFEVAERMLESGLILATRSTAPNNLGLALRGRLGLLYGQTGRPELAKRALQQVLAEKRALYGNSHLLVAEGLSDLGFLSLRQGDYANAEPLLREALRIRRSNDESNAPGAPASPETATTVNNLGLILYLQGKLNLAERYYRESLALRREILPRNHPAIAQSLTNLGLLLQARGQLAQAEDPLREAVRINEEALGVEHNSSAGSLNNLAMVLQAEGKLAEAQAMFDQSLASLRALLPAEHPRIASVLSNLGSVLYDQGKLDRAEQRYRESLRMRRRVHPKGHPYIAYSLVGLGQVLTDRGRFTQALPLLEEALAIRRKAVPEDHWALAESRYALGACLTGLGRLDQAAPLLRYAVESLHTRPEQDRYRRRADRHYARWKAARSHSVDDSAGAVGL